MSLLHEAIQAGIQSAAETKGNKAEIMSVVREVAQLISVYSGGRAMLRLHPALEHEKWGLSAPLAEYGLSDDNTEVISVVDANGRRPVKIARMTISERGYPVVLIFDDSVMQATNRESLESVFAALLQNHGTGLAILSHKEADTSENTIPDETP